MDRKKLAGARHQLQGAVTQGLGKMIGDAKLSADGQNEREIGEADYGGTGGSDRTLGIDADRIKGVAHQIKGAVKAGLGNVLGNAGLEQAGVAERKAGKRQNQAGSARDTAIEAAEPDPMDDR